MKDYLNMALEMVEACSHPSTVTVTDNEAVGQQMRSYREENDVSLREIAKLMDYSPTHICDVEHGRANVSVEFMAEYLKHCNGE